MRPTPPVKTVLLVARQWKGRGGMQRYARDLARALPEADVCRPVFERPRWLLYPFFSMWALLRGIADITRGRRVHCCDAALSPVALALIALGGRVSMTVHGLDLTWAFAPYRYLLRLTLPRLACLVCVSRATAEVVERMGASRDRIRVIPCGVWPEERRDARPAVPTLVSVGRLIERKGVAWFLGRVFARLRASRPEVRYVIVGDGPMRRTIERLIRALGLGDRVTLVPDADDARRDELFLQASVLVAPNVRVEHDMEGFGIACIEASIRGVPVAAARLEGLEDAVIDGKTGRLFVSGDADDCLRTIDDMLDAPLRGVADATAERFDWNTLSSRYRDEVFA